MKKRNENLTCYNEKLVLLYKEVKNIDVKTCRGWALKVAKEMYSLGILKHSDKAPHINSDTEKVDSKIHNHDSAKRLLQSHVNGQCFGIDWLQNYCKYFSCSSDYLLGNIETFNHTQYDEVPLSLKSINAIKWIQQGYIEQSALAVVASDNGIKYIPYTPIDLLNHIISNPAFKDLLNCIEDYIKPGYDTPMFFLDATQAPDGKAHYYIPHNPIHEKIKLDDKGKPILDNNFMPAYDRFLPLAKDTLNPTAYRSVPINDSFLESVAMLQIKNCIDSIKADYLAENSTQ